MKEQLIQKYNVQGPRYTSYPTVPFWDNINIPESVWQESVLQAYQESNAKEGISIYIHLPFCEQLCTFCACHKRITKQHSNEKPYIDTLLKEWGLYLKLFQKTNIKPRLKELHLGGGTPTFFSVEHLKYLLEQIFASVSIDAQAEFSFEGHPNNTQLEHLQMLYNLGFRRVSFGVQDYDETVQKAIHRIQPYAHVARVTQWARDIGYKSISHDLIYGLPFQTWDKMEATIQKTIQLKPDRIAFYSYAHVPWIKGVGQRGFSEADLPMGAEKRMLYELGKKLFHQAGYDEIGMDHFSLQSDDLYKSQKQGTLHRNFMGYTSGKTQLMIGLGMSAISDSWYAFAQNEKNLEAYQERVAEGVLPIVKGHLLNSEDLFIRKQILQLMCQLESHWEAHEFPELILDVKKRLQELADDGLVEIQENGLKIPESAKAFVRNIAMAFDQRLYKNAPDTPIFSSTI